MKTRRREFQAGVPLSGSVVTCMHDALGSSPVIAEKGKKERGEGSNEREKDRREKEKIWIRKGITGFREFLLLFFSFKSMILKCSACENLKTNEH